MTSFPEERFRRELCTGCGTCAAVCPSGAATMDAGSPVFNSGSCIGCGHCGVFCPENAFGLEAAAERDDMASPEGFMALSKNRRSVRKFRDKIPSDEQMNELLSILGQTPTGMNSQGVTVRVLRGGDAAEGLLAPLRKLLGLFARAGVTFLLGKLTGTGEYLERLRKGEDLVFREAPVIMFFFVPRGNITGRADGIIAATTVMYRAASMGMGTLWNGVAEKLYPFFRSWHSPSTRGLRLTAVLCAGYASLEPLQKAPEREYRVIVE